MSELYECAVSGVAVPPAPHEEGDLADCPVGWARVVVSLRTRENPEYSAIHDAIQALTEQQLSMLPPDADEETVAAARGMAKLVSKATFSALLLQTPRYLGEEHEVYVSAAQLAPLLETLGIEEAPEAEADEPEQEEEEE